MADGDPIRPGSPLPRTFGVPDPTGRYGRPTLADLGALETERRIESEKARKAHKKEHAWEVYEAPTPPPPGEFDYLCTVCGERNRSVRPLGNCHYCGKTDLLTRDHIVPRSRGGVDENSNNVFACPTCNLDKSNDLPTCECITCTTAVVQHLLLIESIRHYSPRWASALMAIYRDGPTASQTGMPTPSRFYS